MTNKNFPNRPGCQKDSLKTMRDPDREVLSPPLGMRFRIGFTRHIPPRKKRWILKKLNRFQAMFRKNETVPDAPSFSADNSIKDLKPGDVVRVLSEEQIEKTLGFRRQLKGCAFMDEMRPYCGTIQKVFKPVKRIVDERDGKLKKVKGIVLLEGVNCKGIEKFGSCDRSCFYFWRIEWLEKI